MNPEPDYREARLRVLALKFYYIHLVAYLAVNALLIAINFLTTPTVWWWYFPLLGWGIGLGIHTLSILGWGKTIGWKWEKKKIREFVNKQ